MNSSKIKLIKIKFFISTKINRYTEIENTMDEAEYKLLNDETMEI